MTTNSQWGRKVGLYVVPAAQKGNNPSAYTPPSDALDLSQFRIRFSIQNADIESPNSAFIRVYNLSQQTVKKVTGEFDSVILNAGYENGNYGVIFQGTIKQFRTGRELNATDTFLDILASDGDIGYNQGLVNSSIKAGATQTQALDKIVESMPGLGKDFGALRTDAQHTPALRGQVLFGMARARLRNIATNLDASWSIQDGKVVLIDNTGYRDGEAVDINVGTGLIGLPEQTDQGIRLTCLLNSRIRIGNRVKLNNDEIIQLMQQNPSSSPVSYNSRTELMYNAALSPDGMYRTFVVEHQGDSRGNDWYTFLVCLAVDESAPPDNAVSKQ